MFGVPGFALKSSISLFSRKPAPVTTWPLPYPPLSVVVVDDGVPVGIDDRVVRGLEGFEVRGAARADSRCGVARVSDR